MSDDRLYDKFQVDVDNAVRSRVQYERQKIKRALIIGSVIVLIIIIAIVVGVVVSKKSKDKSGTAYVKARHGCKSFARPAVVFVIIDGFKPEYLKTNLCPNIQKLTKNGVQAEGMRPQFPTKTYPNINTFYTGLYPESHGIVSNEFWNANRTERFYYFPAKGQKTHWYKADPLWVTAKSQGVKSAMYYLYNKDPIKERRPDYWLPYDGGKAPYENRVDKVLSWLEKEASERPYFISLYFGLPDSASHNFGPQAPQTHDGVRKVDKAIGRLINGIKERNLSECTNIILVSDHGMANISCSRAIYFDQMISLENVTIAGESAFMMLYTKDRDQAKNLTNHLKCKSKNLRVYSKYDGSLPERLHYTHNKRIGDIILSPTVGWQVLRNKGKCQDYRGDHGFDNFYPEMWSLFVANGPSFKRGLVIPPFSSVEIYNVLADVLKITPEPNNGTMGSLSHILKNPKNIVKPYYDGDGNNFSMNCTFPKNLTDALNKCKSCVCSYCNDDIEKNLTFYRKSLDLSAKEIKSSFQIHFPLGLPSGGAGNGGCILTQRHYIIGYSWHLHIPLWVGYHLTAKQLLVNVWRKNCFRRDIRLTSAQSSFCSDYSWSGYDRGHLAPSGDFNFERVAEQDTFMLSNIAPQHKYFNRNPGLWFKSEDLFRTWAIKYDSVYVISGSIFDADGDGIQDKDTDNKRWLKDQANTVAIPTHFYKIIVRCNTSVTTDYNIPNCKGNLESLSFVFPHNTERDCKLRDWTTRLLEYTASIRDIERLTGQNLFPNLPFPFSARFKANLPSKLWPVS